MTPLIAGALSPVTKRSLNWGDSCVLRASDNLLACSGVNSGDYLIVDKGSIPSDGEALVVILGNGCDEKAPKERRAKKRQSLLLRKLECYGQRVRLQPGSSPWRPLLQTPDEAGIWGTVVAVLRKFEAM